MGLRPRMEYRYEMYVKTLSSFISLSVLPGPWWLKEPIYNLLFVYVTLNVYKSIDTHDTGEISSLGQF